jgi:hypothetical protein
VIFHSGVKKELKDVTGITNQKLNDLPKIIHQNCNALRLNKKLHGNQFGTLSEKKIGTIRPL